MTTPAPDQIEALHALYVRLTGFNLRLDMAREHTWFLWMRAGFTEADLHLVVYYLKDEIKNGRRNPGALKFSNLIANPDYFEEDLALARSAADRAARFHIQPTPPAPHKINPGQQDTKKISTIIAGLSQLKSILAGDTKKDQP